MAERMTTIRARDRALDAQGVGLTNYGHRSRTEMLTEMRAYFQHQLDLAQRVLAMTDDEFIVETHTGLHVRSDVKEVTA